MFYCRLKTWILEYLVWNTRVCLWGKFTEHRINGILEYIKYATRVSIILKHQSDNSEAATRVYEKWVLEYDIPASVNHLSILIFYLIQLYHLKHHSILSMIFLILVLSDFQMFRWCSNFDRPKYTEEGNKQSLTRYRQAHNDKSIKSYFKHLPIQDHTKRTPTKQISGSG